MTKGFLSIETEHGPVVMDFDIQDDKDGITIEILAKEAKIHTPDEPKLIAGAG